MRGRKSSYEDVIILKAEGDAAIHGVQNYQKGEESHTTFSFLLRLTHTEVEDSG
jgi:hypothetical protein